LNYYQILGINYDAGPEEIRRAYRVQALRYHPDRNPDLPNAEKLFREISQAYQTLKDPVKRVDYDAMLQLSLIRARQKPDIAPKITLFIASSYYVLPSDIVEFFWQTSHADIAYLYPFGMVPPTGRKKIKLNKFNRSPFKVSLTAYSSISMKKHSAEILIYDVMKLPRNQKQKIIWNRRIDKIYRHYKVILGLIVFVVIGVLTFTYPNYANKSTQIVVNDVSYQIITKENSNFEQELQDSIKNLILVEQDPYELKIRMNELVMFFESKYQ
jgi:curved DNA-binding protein CbpA